MRFARWVRGAINRTLRGAPYAVRGAPYALPRDEADHTRYTLLPTELF